MIEPKEVESVADQAVAREELQDTMDAINMLDGVKNASNKDGQDFIDQYLSGDFN